MMRDKPDTTQWEGTDLEALREILLAEDREAITYLAEQIALLRDQPVDPEVLRAHLKVVVPEILAEELADTSDVQSRRWAPMVLSALQQRAHEDPEEVAEALQPVMGKLTRAYFRQVFRGRSSGSGAARKRPVAPTEPSRASTPPEEGASAQPWANLRFQRDVQANQTRDTATASPYTRRKTSPSRPPWTGRLRFPFLVYAVLILLFVILLYVGVRWFSDNLDRSAAGQRQTTETTSEEAPPDSGRKSTTQQATGPTQPTDESHPAAFSDVVSAAQAEVDALVAESPLLFDLNQRTLPSRSRVTLDRIAAILKKYPGTALRIHVYTDNTGPAIVNKQISQKRGEAIKRYLSTEGRITPFRMAVLGHGPENSIASNSTPSGQRANRRAEFEILPRRRETL